MDHPFEYVRSDHRPDDVGPDGLPAQWIEFDLWRCGCCGEEVWGECIQAYDDNEYFSAIPESSDPMKALEDACRPKECPDDLATVWEVMTR